MSRPTFTAKLDPRLVSDGHRMTVVDLARLWADHTPPAKPVPDRCQRCGHLYDQTAPFCPTAAAVRPLLRRRRNDRAVLHLLTSNQLDDLLNRGRPSTALTWKADF